MSIGNYVAQRSSIGINGGRIRGINSRIRGGEIKHTGVMRSSKNLKQRLSVAHKTVFVEGVQQFHFPIWHKEIEDIIVLKNNKGTEDNRVRKLDYSIQLSKLFYERFINDEDITLFSHMRFLNFMRHGVQTSLTNLYETAERKTSVSKKESVSTKLVF